MMLALQVDNLSGNNQIFSSFFSVFKTFLCVALNGDSRKKKKVKYKLIVGVPVCILVSVLLFMFVFDFCYKNASQFAQV